MITKIPKQLWRVTNKNSLAYLTSYEDDAAFKKREKTGLDWAAAYSRNAPGHVVQGIIFDNEPTTGFKLDDFAERSRTDNKLMQVSDPRGFSVEISIKNFFDLMVNSVIDHGAVQGVCVWGREGNNLALIPINSELYIKITNETENLMRTVDKLYPGNVFKFPNQTTEYIYYGAAILSYRVEVVRTNYCRGMFSKKNSTEEIVETRDYVSKKEEAVTRQIYSNGLECLSLQTINPERKCVLIRSGAATDRGLIDLSPNIAANTYYVGSSSLRISPQPKGEILKDLDNLAHGRDIHYRWAITNIDWKD